MGLCKRKYKRSKYRTAYPSVPEAVLKDEKLYELLAITDAIRVGRTREKELAVEYLKKYLKIV